MGIRGAALMSAVALLCSCQPLQQTGGDITVALSSSEFILLDAPGKSCRAVIDNASADDVSPLHMNLGRMTITWDGEANTELKVVYVKLNVVSGGLSSSDRPITIASQDLNCLMNGSRDEEKLKPAQATFPFQKSIMVGGLRATDGTLRSSFSGTVNMIVYAIKQRADGSETPLVGRASGRFSFQGIF